MKRKPKFKDGLKDLRDVMVSKGNSVWFRRRRISRKKKEEETNTYGL